MSLRPSPKSLDAAWLIWKEEASAGHAPIGPLESDAEKIIRKRLKWNQDKVS